MRPQVPKASAGTHRKSDARWWSELRESASGIHRVRTLSPRCPASSAESLRREDCFKMSRVLWEKAQKNEWHFLRLKKKGGLTVTVLLLRHGERWQRHQKSVVHESPTPVISLICKGPHLRMLCYCYSASFFSRQRLWQVLPLPYVFVPAYTSPCYGGIM